eukprot:COSAG04_NODE_1230_length_7679_cov_1.728232_2_plen_395_part_00
MISVGSRLRIMMADDGDEPGVTGFVFGNVEKGTGRLEADGRYDDETRENLDEAGHSAFAQDAKADGLGLTRADEMAAATSGSPVPQSRGGHDLGGGGASGGGDGGGGVRSDGSDASLAGKVLRRGAGIYEDEDGENYDDDEDDEPRAGERILKVVGDFYGRVKRPARARRRSSQQPARQPRTNLLADERVAVSTARFGHLHRGASKQAEPRLPRGALRSAADAPCTGASVRGAATRKPTAAAQGRPFLPVQSQAWENEIVWDDDDDDDPPPPLEQLPPDTRSAEGMRNWPTEPSRPQLSWGRPCHKFRLDTSAPPLLVVERSGSTTSVRSVEQCQCGFPKNAHGSAAAEGSSDLASELEDFLTADDAEGEREAQRRVDASTESKLHNISLPTQR